MAALRVPEDVALVGVDNDTLECELPSPPLSSVAVPWQQLGHSSARIVERLLAGEGVKPELTTISPLTVVARRSSEVLAVDEELIARAVTWIRSNTRRRMNVGTVVSAVGSGRQRLERGFRRVLGCTIQEEIRRSRVETAKRLLETTDGDMKAIARRSGFTTAGLLNRAFQRELGTTPGAYRRRVRGVRKVDY
jgi:LacI family transcriptional regulator